MSNRKEIPYRFTAVPEALHLLDLDLEEQSMCLALLSFSYGKTKCWPGLIKLSRRARLPIYKEGTGHEECRVASRVLARLQAKDLVGIIKVPLAKDRTKTPKRFRSEYDFTKLIAACMAAEQNLPDVPGEREEEEEAPAPKKAAVKAPVPVKAPEPVQKAEPIFAVPKEPLSFDPEYERKKAKDQPREKARLAAFGREELAKAAAQYTGPLPERVAAFVASCTDDQALTITGLGPNPRLDRKSIEQMLGQPMTLFARIMIQLPDQERADWDDARSVWTDIKEESVAVKAPEPRRVSQSFGFGKANLKLVEEVVELDGPEVDIDPDDDIAPEYLDCSEMYERPDSPWFDEEESAA